MKLIIPPIEIDKEEPFKHSVLNRKEFAESLTGLVSNTEDPLVILLEGKWGEGKSTFVKMWGQHLKNNGVENTYFDAFKYDFLETPFVSIVGALVEILEKKLGKTKTNDLKKKASKLGTKLVSFSGKTALRLLTLNTIDASGIEDIKSIGEDIVKGLTTEVEKSMEEAVSSFDKDRKLIEDFRKSLESLAKDTKEKTGNSLVFFVDELDRCKPTYAVNVIEIIKHFFSVDNIVFVLVVHKKQLEEYIRCLYGQNMDATNYLQKFINIECALPKTISRSDMSNNDYRKYCSYLFDGHELGTVIQNKDSLVDMVVDLSEHYGLSLRDLEKVFTYLILFFNSVQEKEKRFHFENIIFILSLAIFKVHKPDVFYMLKNKKLNYEEFRSLAGLEDFIDSEGCGERVMKMFRGLLVNEVDYHQLLEAKKVYDMRMPGLSVSREQILPFCTKYFETFKFNE